MADYDRWRSDRNRERNRDDYERDTSQSRDRGFRGYNEEEQVYGRGTFARDDERGYDDYSNRGRSSNDFRGSYGQENLTRGQQRYSGGLSGDYDRDRYGQGYRGDESSRHIRSSGDERYVMGYRYQDDRGPDDMRGSYGPGAGPAHTRFGSTGYRNYGENEYGYRSGAERSFDRPSTGYYSGDRNYGRGHMTGRSFERDDRDFWDRATDEVASWFGDDDAQRRRDMDKAHRGRGPKSYQRSDERIREDINDRLTDDAFIDASEIDVTVKDREVTLSGIVSSRQAKRRAEDLAEAVSGVNHVQNNLRVSLGMNSAGPTTNTLTTHQPTGTNALNNQSTTASNPTGINSAGSDVGLATTSTGSRSR